MDFACYFLLFIASCRLTFGYNCNKLYIGNNRRQKYLSQSSWLNEKDDNLIIEVDKFRFKVLEPDIEKRFLSEEESYTVEYNDANSAYPEEDANKNINMYHASLESAQQWCLANEFPSVEDDNIKLDQYVESILSRGYFREVHPDIDESWKTIKRRYLPLKFLQWLFKGAK